MVLESAAVVVPMYNEALAVGDVVDALRTRFGTIICVDDGSTDCSAEVARAAGATVLRHRVNLGQGAALQTGFEFALSRTDALYVVTFDADGQHSVSDAEAMVLRAQQSGVDVVLGSRTAGRPVDQPLARRLLLRAALRYSRWSSGLDLTDTHNGLRVLSRSALRVINLRQPGMAYASELESLIVARDLSWVEHPVTITYSAYSMAKGQRNLNAFNIVYDLLTAKLTATP